MLWYKRVPHVIMKLKGTYMKLNILGSGQGIKKCMMEGQVTRFPDISSFVKIAVLKSSKMFLMVVQFHLHQIDKKSNLGIDLYQNELYN